MAVGFMAARMSISDGRTGFFINFNHADYGMFRYICGVLDKAWGVKIRLSKKKNNWQATMSGPVARRFLMRMRPYLAGSPYEDKLQGFLGDDPGALLEGHGTFRLPWE